MRAQPLIVVKDVQASSRWYQTLLGAKDEHGGSEYARLKNGDALILQLHDAEVDHHHPAIADPKVPHLGNGVLLWFEVDDFDATVKRAEALGARVWRAEHVNPNPDHRELWLYDPDGYGVVIASPDGEASSKQ